jgi:hypothetical protein
MQTLAERLSQVLRCGTLSLDPSVTLAAGRMRPDVCEVTDPAPGEVRVRLRYGESLTEELVFTFRDDHVVCHRSTTNIGNTMAGLRETGLGIRGLRFPGDPADDYFYHVENLRLYSRWTMPVDLRRTPDLVEDSGFDSVAGNRWADPGTVCDRIGASINQPFPALLLSNPGSSCGLVHGTLSQRVFFHSYLVEHRNGALVLDVISSLKALDLYDLAPGRTLHDLWYLGRTDEAANVERVFAGYARELRKRLPPLWGATDINRHSLVWGSWNDGTFRDIHQDSLLRTADFLAEHFPTVEWMQIDDGYARRAGELQIAHGLGMPYEGEAGVARDKFPEGLKAFADHVRARGLRPAVWIGGFVPHETPLYRDHPDWFIDYSYRVKDQSPLDVSQPVVREYMEHALDVFFREYGFEGMKHDFWSYAFEDSRGLLARHSASGYEWRTWWLQEIRARLPADGYLQTGCDIVMGNPFLGEYFTNYRYGIDIGGGEWENVKTTALWGAACFALHFGDRFVPNSDSVGLYPGLSDDEAFLCLTFCLISRSMVEIAGRLYDADPGHPRFKALKKAVCCPNNGQDVFFVDFDYRTATDAPAAWYLTTPHFSLLEGSDALPLRTLALFNFSDETRELPVDLTRIGLDTGSYFATDVWRGGTRIEHSGLIRTLPPHGSLLLSISRASDAPQILDADLKIDAVTAGPDTLAIRFGHRGPFTLTLSRKPVNSGFRITAQTGGWIVSGTAVPGVPLHLVF